MNKDVLYKLDNYKIAIDICDKDVPCVMVGKHLAKDVIENIFGYYSKDVVDFFLTVINKLKTKDQRIAELEEQLKDCIRPKFKIGQEIWETTPLMSWKIKRIEWHKFNGGNGDVVIEIYRLGHDGTDDYNCCITPEDNYRFFATKEEAEERLKELQGENK